MIVKPTPAGLSIQVGPADIERMRKRAAYFDRLAADAVRRARDTLAASGENGGPRPTFTIWKNPEM